MFAFLERMGWVRRSRVGFNFCLHGDVITFVLGLLWMLARRQSENIFKLANIFFSVSGMPEKERWWRLRKWFWKWSCVPLVSEVLTDEVDPYRWCDGLWARPKMRGGKVFIDFEPLDNGRTVEMPRIVSWIHSPHAPWRMNAVENIDTKPKSADPSSSAGEITLE